MTLPPLQELAFLPLEEAEASIQLALAGKFYLDFELQENLWHLRLKDLEGTVLWASTAPDRRLLLFEAYGEILRDAGAEIKHPLWRRTREVQIPIQYGKVAYQGDIQTPDYEDLSPEEVMRIYGLASNEGKSK